VCSMWYTTWTFVPTKSPSAAPTAPPTPTPTLAPTMATCTDAIMNGAESDTDCGGAECSPCGAGKACTTHTDCISGECIGTGTDAAGSGSLFANTCNFPTPTPAPAPTPALCSNGIHDGAETDIDCGGPECPPCSVGLLCAGNTDCVSDICAGGRCNTPKPTVAPTPLPYIKPIDSQSGSLVVDDDDPWLEGNSGAFAPGFMALYTAACILAIGVLYCMSRDHMRKTPQSTKERSPSPRSKRQRESTSDDFLSNLEGRTEAGPRGSIIGSLGPGQKLGQTQSWNARFNGVYAAALYMCVCCLLLCACWLQCMYAALRAAMALSVCYRVLIATTHF
jgi:hypothetical protein